MEQYSHVQIWYKDNNTKHCSDINNIFSQQKRWIYGLVRSTFMASNSQVYDSPMPPLRNELSMLVSEGPDLKMMQLSSVKYI